MKRTITSALGVAVAALLITGCSPASNPDGQVTTIPTPAATVAPTPSPTPEAEPGTRAAPLSPGEMKLLTTGSVWSVGASADTLVADGYVVLPLHVDIDWDAAIAQGADVENEGVNPGISLFVEYVTAAGKSYDMFDTTGMDYPDPVENELWEFDVVYPPTESIEANVAVTVPAAEVPGGTWRVSNTTNKSVFIAGASAG